MKVFVKLIKIYLASVFNFKNLKAQIQKRKRKNGETVVKNSAAKIVGIAVLFIFVFMEFLFIFGLYTYGLYSAAKDMNNIKFLFEVSVFIISLLSFIFGFILTASTYYIGEIEEQFLSMPIKPKVLFGAKFAANCVNSLITSVSFFAVLMFVYGINEQPYFLFYVWGFICSLVIPLPIIALCYFFNIFLMRFTRVFKNKNVIMIISSVIGILISLWFQYIFQSSTKGGLEDIAAKLSGGSVVFEHYGYFYPPVKLVGKILTSSESLSAVLYLVLLIALCAAFPALVIFFMSKMYTESLIGFGEKKVKKLEANEISSFIRKKIKSMPPLAAYTKREFDMMNRTPIYFLNGPFIIIFMPVLLAVIFFAKGINLNSIPSSLFSFMHESTGFVVAGLAAGFLGSMSNIADTALSRDAKFLPFIKSLPVNISEYMYAKLIHSMIFAVFAVLIGVGIPAFIFQFDVLNIVLASLTALSFSGLTNLISLFLDTAHPKLHWDNPVSAMKQNINVLFMTLFNFIMTAVSVTVLIFARNAYTWVLVVYFIAIPFGIFAVLIKPYGIYAEKKIAKLEL
ncbi:hypothetical protein [Treponema pedis]|uniref:ABC-2 type transport system permease protein n=2 Tax=Treponema pedis TaxID=409322 RepID=S6A077_9SPIR|nr:hypothetical protein [Treponema pedis]AGT44053.1 hypothetical protein TPE_1558 [Treponema pedis str. T A4]